MSGPTIGELFAGYGGIGLGVKEVWPDAQIAWVSDVCKFAKDGSAGHHEPHRAPCSILAHHYPDAPNPGDITKVDWSTVEPVDIITGGSPCQDLSHAGKRAGMKAGTRSGLWASMCDAIDILRPSLVIWENVRGALSADAITGDVESCGFCMADRDGQPMRALGRVLGDLADVGYDAAWVGLRAADVGACHGRFRVFVLAWPQSDPGALTWPQSDPGALLPTPAVNDMGAAYTPETWDAWTDRMRAAHGNGNGHGASLSIEALRLLPSPRTSDTNGAGTHGDGGLDLRTAVSLLPTPTTRDTKGRNQRDDETCLTGALLPTPKSCDWKASGVASPAAINHVAAGFGTLPETVAVNAATFGTYAPAIARWESLTRPAPSPTEPTGKGGAHRLSPRFVEWMMGLPDGWVTDVHGITRNDMLKALGNGVVPQQAAEAIRWLLDVRAMASERVA